MKANEKSNNKYNINNSNIHNIGRARGNNNKIVSLKFLSLGWLWLVAKANNYFYQGE